LLATDELVVEALLRTKLVVGARFHDATSVDDSDAVRVLDSRQPVGDDDARPADTGFLQRFLDDLSNL
jgi:hypothetical protein